MVHTITVQTTDRRRSFIAATPIRYRPIQHQRQLVTPVTVGDVNSPIVGEIPVHNEKKIAPPPRPRPIQGVHRVHHRAEIRHRPRNVKRLAAAMARARRCRPCLVNSC